MPTRAHRSHISPIVSTRARRPLSRVVVVVVVVVHRTRLIHARDIAHATPTSRRVTCTYLERFTHGRGQSSSPNAARNDHARAVHVDGANSDVVDPLGVEGLVVVIGQSPPPCRRGHRRARPHARARPGTARKKKGGLPSRAVKIVDRTLRKPYIHIL